MTLDRALPAVLCPGLFISVYQQVKNVSYVGPGYSSKSEVTADVYSNTVASVLLGENGVFWYALTNAVLDWPRSILGMVSQ